jgi:hypothetical protein
VDDRFAFPNRNARNRLTNAGMRHLQLVDLDLLDLKFVNVPDRALGSAITKYAETDLFGDFKIVAALSEDRFRRPDTSGDHKKCRARQKSKSQNT